MIKFRLQFLAYIYPLGKNYEIYDSACNMIKYNITYC